MMPPIPLFTSLPPRLRGQPIDANGAETLQAVVVKSWLEAGFAPVSINTAMEHAAHPGLKGAIESLGVRSVTVGIPDGSDGNSAGRGLDQLPSMAAFLRAVLATSPTGTVAIANADIGLRRDMTCPGFGHCDGVGRFWIGQRLDLGAVPLGDGIPEGVMDLNGFDFVAFPAEAIPSLEELLPQNLRLGLPWWDHYLPIALLMLGLRPRLVRPGTLWHLQHDDRWLNHSFVSIGLPAARQFAAVLSRRLESPASRAWMRIYSDRFDPRSAQNWRDQWVRRLIEASLAPDTFIRNRLGVLGCGNVALLLQAASS